MPPTGKGDRKVLFVSEAPGEQEENAQRPLVGAAGNEMARGLRRAGVRRGDCHITNVLLCRPPGNKLKKFLHKLFQRNHGEQQRRNRQEGRKPKANDKLPRYRCPAHSPNKVETIAHIREGYRSVANSLPNFPS